MRFAAEASGGGKSGGIRVCYFIVESKRIYLVTLFAKQEKDNLSKGECNIIAALIAAIQKEERGR